jgi:sporulation protein YlmC with PRC-barrel domain
MAVNNKMQPNQTTFDELCDELSHGGKYAHLRLILTKNNNHEYGQQYLMVTPSAFGVVKLIDIDFRDNHIYIELQDCVTGTVKDISVDIDDDKFNFLLISWTDIKKIVLAENKNIFNHDELLDFNYRY